MWEFSLNLRSENFNLAKSLFNSIKEFSAKVDGVVTSHEQQGFICILIGTDDKFKQDYENFLCKLLTKTICTHYKSEFLSQNLILPRHDKIGLLAFKKALLNFDRETDYFIIQRALKFDKELYFESFYDFKLLSLKSKWAELVSLANDNRDYLMSNDSFLDLLKFLIDNLDICEDEVDIIEQQDGYKLYLGNEDFASLDFSNTLLNEEGLISSIIDLSPQKINLYCQKENGIASLLEKLFVERINVTTIGTSIKKINNK